MNVTEDPDAAGLVPAVIAILTAGATDGFTVMVILLLLAFGVVAQDELEVRVHATTEPLASVVVENVAELVPEAMPFTVHAYDGVLPPLVGVAVNVTDAPAQLGLLPEVRAMLRPGAEGAVTVTVMAFDVAGLPITPLWLEVITQVTTSPLANVDEL